MQLSISTVLLALAAVGSAAIVDNEGVRNVPRELIEITAEDLVPDAAALAIRAAPRVFADNNGRTIANGGCCNHGVNLRQDICNNGGPSRCIPAAKTREGCIGLTCVLNTKLTCDPNQKDRGRDKCVLKPGQ